MEKIKQDLLTRVISGSIYSYNRKWNLLGF